MSVTLTNADVKAIIEYCIEQCAPLPGALAQRMSDRQLEMASEMYTAAGERDMADADELKRFKKLGPEEKAAVVASIERRDNA
jgi:hypothetical protein